MPKILVFAGSARRDSLNKKLARAVADEIAAQAAEATFLDLDDYPMPVYHGDLESREGMPENAKRLREIFIAHDALAIASPENNQSITSLLKNTIDWLSRGVGDGKGANSGLAPYRGKVAALFAASPGPYGGVRHLPQLRQSLGGLGVLVIGPQLALIHADQAFDEAGRLRDPGVARAMKGVVTELVETAGRTRG
ncbi:MAG TPA: NAD(P)H-dependent oxidoreductase [Usitatibacter sp.]|nr:NAD(P)H-dependent oxidoreductase [Usitatibacter sp.]